MSNVFAAERPLIEQIRTLVPGLADVGSVSKLAGYQPDQIPTPAVYVMPGESQVPGGADDPEDGAVQIDRQTWEVVVVVAHQQDVLTDDTDTTAKRAGEILFQVMQALVGWRPAQGFLPFAYRGRPAPDYSPGYAEFPALFQTGLVITGNN